MTLLPLDFLHQHAFDYAYRKGYNYLDSESYATWYVDAYGDGLDGYPSHPDVTEYWAAECVEDAYDTRDLDEEADGTTCVHIMLTLENGVSFEWFWPGVSDADALAEMVRTFGAPSYTVKRP